MTEHDPLIEELDLAVMPPQSRALTNAQVLDIVRRARIAGEKAERRRIVEWLYEVNPAVIPNGARGAVGYICDEIEAGYPPRPRSHCRGWGGVMVWQPIETAPSDGTRVLAWADRRGWEKDGRAIVVCAWHSSRWAIMGANGSGQWPDTKDECTPHFWQPLPAPPERLPPLEE